MRPVAAPEDIGLRVRLSGRPDDAAVRSGQGEGVDHVVALPDGEPAAQVDLESVGQRAQPARRLPGGLLDVTPEVAIRQVAGVEELRQDDKRGTIGRGAGHELLGVVEVRFDLAKPGFELDRSDAEGSTGHGAACRCSVVAEHPDDRVGPIHGSR